MLKAATQPIDRFDPLSAGLFLFVPFFPPTASVGAENTCIGTTMSCVLSLRVCQPTRSDRGKGGDLGFSYLSLQFYFGIGSSAGGGGEGPGRGRGGVGLGTLHDATPQQVQRVSAADYLHG